MSQNHWLSNIPASTPKKGVANPPTQIPSPSRRQSIAGYPNGGPNPAALSVAASPQPPATPAGPGLPSFRGALRSLLPFGPSKSSSAPTSMPPVVARSSSFGFASVRKSMTRERKGSLSKHVMPPVIAIEPSKSDIQVDEVNIRRSVSLSQLDVAQFHEAGRSTAAPVLRTPSPGLPLSLELSTIIEADSSGISKHGLLSLTNSNSTPSSPTFTNTDLLHVQREKSSSSQQTAGADTSDFDADTSVLELSPADLTKEVLDALNSSDPSSGGDWFSPGKPIVIDADTVDESFNLPSVDPALTALLSPNSVRTERPPSHLPRLRSVSRSPVASPSTPKFPTTPTTPNSTAITPNASPFTVRSSSARSSPTTPSFPPTSTPAPKRSFIANPGRMFTPTASSSLSASTGARMLNADKATNIGKGKPPRTLRNMLLGHSPSRMNDNSDVSGNLQPLPRISLSSPTRTPGLSRSSLDSRRPYATPSKLETPLRPSLDIPRNAASGPRRTSFELRRGVSALAEQRPKPGFYLSSRPSLASEIGSSVELRSSPSPPTPESRTPDEHVRSYRPQASLDSSAALSRSSIDSSRPASSLRRERQRTPSLQGSANRPPAAGLSPSLQVSNDPRTRKRSMSVQERFVDLSMITPSASASSTDLVSSRPGTSMSMGHGPRSSRLNGRGGDGGGEREHAALRHDWLTSRTSSKAFRAAGLLDRDRDSERDNSDVTEHPGSDREFIPRNRSGSVGINLGSSTVISPSPLSGSTIGRYNSVRASSEYNPSNPRALSRMAFSEVGGPTNYSTRRGSGSFSTHTSNLMESPTFTASSGSRDRDTPRSAVSTAATSISGYFGRDKPERERDRDREEVRELVEKHSTEMGALLGALSDTQRTVRLLREENSDLRERLSRTAHLERENEELRRIYGQMRRECVESSRANGELKREISSLRVPSPRPTPVSAPASSWNSSSLQTPVAKQRYGHGRDYYNHHTADDRSDREPSRERDLLRVPSRSQRHPTPSTEDHSEDILPEYLTANSSTTTTATSATVTSTPHHTRRPSTSSSIFPTLPSNMSMLLNEDDFDSHSNSNRSSMDQYRYPAAQSTGISPSPSHSPLHQSTRSVSIPRSARMQPVSEPQSIPGPSTGFGHRYGSGSRDFSISSAHNISPTTANFSIMSAGSPKSLFLKPEHEMYLDEMESLDLGAKLEELQLGLVNDPDAW